MRRRIPVAIAAVAVAVGLAAPASAGISIEIEVSDNKYAPKEPDIGVGQGVHWFVDGPTEDGHNVLANGKLFDSGPLEEEVDYAITPSAGTFAYYCKAHGTKSGHGMAGTLNVPPLEASTKRGGDIYGVQWAVEESNTGDRYDVRYKGPGTNGKYKTWLKNQSEVEAIFGQDNDPVNVKPGKTYNVQVRSEDSSNPSKEKSGWSPALKLGVN
jgi:plastocyanin